MDLCEFHSSRGRVTYYPQDIFNNCQVALTSKPVGALPKLFSSPQASIMSSLKYIMTMTMDHTHNNSAKVAPTVKEMMSILMMQLEVDLV